MKEKEEEKKDTKATTTAIAVKIENVADQVLAKVSQMTGSGTLKLPPDYSPENSLKGAFTMLQEMQVGGKPVLEVCTKDSVAMALYKMIVRGLNPLKNQCYLIPYGNKLTLTPSYFGNLATAKRVGLKEIAANVIYKKDKFTFKINPDTGNKELVDHDTKIENIDLNEISGAYCIYTLADGTKSMEIMNMKQIQTAWLQGSARGASPAHKNFGDQMCLRTVINRACKTIINSSDDSYLFDDKDENQKPEERTEITDNANTENLTFQDAEEVVSEVVDKPEVQETQPIEPAPKPKVEKVTKTPDNKPAGQNEMKF